MTDNTDIRQLQDLPIANVLFPDRAGPRMLPYNVPIAAGVEFVLDLMQAQLTGKENRVQTMEIDNTRGGADVIIQMGFQRIQISAGELQLIPLYVTGSPLQFFCDVANVVPVKFFNVPMPAYTRRVSGSKGYWNSRQTTQNNFLAGIPGKRYVVTNLHIQISGDAAQAVAGYNTFTLTDGTSFIGRATAYVPAAAGVGFGQSLLDMDGVYLPGVEGAGLSFSIATPLNGLLRLT